ncbi:histone-fold-containing protein [Lindgomyces ingoldianus]|uniref:Histone-fold-containing protein n=1 Tax=Lindgomyces ingoldianus TaxID=673940 RepID=A0ACB6R1A0_9PLEO|nr:histone-fold-containing protein [Lindgomyces ingoldianus]KAF2472102.1 histone-fold-containing protein [Lindgomyces ingoldianus]
MPPRKSNISAVSPEEPAKAASKEDGLSVEELNLPKSIVQRLAKGVLPPNTQIQKDALLAMSKSATVFVNYLTHYAAENAARSNKKTVMPKDVFDAMQELEFESFLPRLEAEVAKFTSIQADKRNSYRKKVREEKKAQKDTSEGKPRAANGHAAGVDDSPPAKRARRSSVDNGEHASGSEEEADVDETVEEEQQEDEEVEEDEEGEEEEEGAEEQLTEDPIEARESEASDEGMEDGDESD